LVILPTWNYRQRRDIQAGRWNILGISQLSERHSSLQELSSAATDHA
jgi:hypothetical protein